MLVVFPAVFAADTKLIYGHNLVAPLIKMKQPFSIVHKEFLVKLVLADSSNSNSIFPCNSLTLNGSVANSPDFNQLRKQK